MLQLLGSAYLFWCSKAEFPERDAFQCDYHNQPSQDWRWLNDQLNDLEHKSPAQNFGASHARCRRHCLGSVGGSAAIRRQRVEARSIHSRGHLKFPGKSLDFPSSNHQFMLKVSDPAQQCGTRTTTRHGLLTLCPMKTNFVSLKRLEGLNSCCCSIFLMSRLSSQHSNKAVHN
jgi:hypothetical protein